MLKQNIVLKAVPCHIIQVLDEYYEVVKIMCRLYFTGD